jgi:hypothetical protein
VVVMEESLDVFGTTALLRADGLVGNTPLGEDLISDLDVALCPPLLDTKPEEGFGLLPYYREAPSLLPATRRRPSPPPSGLRLRAPPARRRAR